MIDGDSIALEPYASAASLEGVRKGDEEEDIMEIDRRA